MIMYRHNKGTSSIPCRGSRGAS
uniref:Uncharacterized protein n=1 Tax=Arundo donax TaxID=35708 RepID=A0A0A9EFM8_ARUDO